MLAQYRRRALITIFAFILSAVLMTLGFRAESAHPLILFAVFLSAAFWIGMTALCRHSYVILKTAMWKRIGFLEFLSTNLVIFMFPVAYRKLKKEVEFFKAGAGDSSTRS